MKLAGVQFVHTLKIYDFEQGDLELNLGDWVLVETVQGQEMGKIIYRNKNKKNIEDEIRPILRKATEEDLGHWKALRDEALSYLPEFEKQIKYFNLKMRPISADLSLDGSRLTFYFSSENRIDFRDLVKEMARIFKKQIRLLQIGSRDVGRILGGYGRCGKEICCHTFLNGLESVTMDMVRDQNITAKSSAKVSGLCGKLMCCLAFEVEEKGKIGTIEKEIKKQLKDQQEN